MNIEIVKAIRIFTADGRKVLVDDESAVAAVEGMINKYDTAPNNQTAALVRPKRTRTAKTREVAPKILPPPRHNSRQEAPRSSAESSRRDPQSSPCRSSQTRRGSRPVLGNCKGVSGE